MLYAPAREYDGCLDTVQGTCGLPAPCKVLLLLRQTCARVEEDMLVPLACVLS
jgi:hypothetical protein